MSNEIGTFFQTFVAFLEYLYKLKHIFSFFQICDICGKSFKTKASLRLHQVSHVPLEDRKTYFCKICGKVLWTSGSLKSHEKQCAAKGCSKHF